MYLLDDDEGGEHLSTSSATDMNRRMENDDPDRCNILQTSIIDELDRLIERVC